jgi:phage shock protein PspC (stress-responsive transcriptional regulator)
MSAMTTERARRTTDPAPPATAGQRLHRRSTDRVIGGVAGGIADYLNVDPLLVRAAFVGLMIFGAAGLFIYLAVWLLVPVEGSDESVLEAVLSRVGLRGASMSRLGWLALGVVAAIFFIQLQSYPYGYYPFFIDPRFVLALIVIVGGIMFMRRNSARAPAGEMAAGPGGAVAPVAAAEPAPARAARVRRPRERSPLALYTIGGLLVVFGLIAAVDGLTDTQVVPGVYVGAVLATVGIGLVVGAWWGRARWLIAIGILLVPIAIVASFITAPLEGGWGEHFAAPSSIGEIQDEYRLAGGRLTLDLRDVPRSAADREITASVGIGQLVVIVPELAGVDVTARVGAGTTWLLSDSQGPGTELETHRTAGGSAGTYTLDLEVGMGEVLVERMDGSAR